MIRPKNHLIKAGNGENFRNGIFGKFCKSFKIKWLWAKKEPIKAGTIDLVWAFLQSKHLQPIT